jgi:hypothetical protein
MTMSFFSPSNSYSKDNTNYRDVFRSDEKTSMFDRGSNDSSPLHILSRAPKIRENEIDHDENSIQILERLSLSPSSMEPDSEREFLFAESRDPDEFEQCSYTENRSGAESDRTECVSSTDEYDRILPSRRTSCEEESSGALKRANPIYESETEAEHVDINPYVKRRRNVVAGFPLSNTKPLFWAERLSSE